MSRLWREELRLGLSPTRLTLVRLNAGWRRQVVEKKTLPLEETANGEEIPFAAALEQLQALLKQSDASRADAVVTLSNRLVRYVTVPWNAEVVQAEERAAYVRYLFTKVYGTTVADWTLRHSEGDYGKASVAAGIDSRLLQGLRGAIEGSQARLHSVQPHLMGVFNLYRRFLNKGHGWLVVAEAGRLEIALLYRGDWHSLRRRRVQESLQFELPEILDQERLLTGLADAPQTLYLHAPEYPNFMLPRDSSWSLQVLYPKQQPGYSPLVDREYSLAMSVA